MRIEKGQNRIVLVIPKLGIVIKFSVISFLKALHCFIGDIKGRNWEYFKRKGIPKIKDYLFLGIVHNWHEFYFYFRTRNVFLQPTYFSFFGLCNIQKIGKLCEFSVTAVTDLWCQLHELSNGKVWGHCHHFVNPKNFCFDGKLRIFDYGDKRTQEVISECGVKIFNEFNPNYGWDVEKEKLKEKKLT